MANYELTDESFYVEHNARQNDPMKYNVFRRSHPNRFPEGVDVIFGIKFGRAEIQAVRFNAEMWTVEDSQIWLRTYGFKDTVEAATKKSKNIWEGLF